MTNRLDMKRRLGRLFALFARPRPRQVVLLYHSVGGGPWSLPKSLFARQVRYLSEAACPFAVGADAAANEAKELRVALTFDDGYASMADVVAPIVKDFGWRPEVYLNTGWIGDGERRATDHALGHYPRETFMSWADVERLAADGWEIGSHGVDHTDLTIRDRDWIDTELVESKRTLETRLHRPCQGFSYTWGRHNSLVRDRVGAAGYKYACTGEHAAITQSTRALEIPRLNIDSAYDFEDFLAVTRGDWDYLRWLQKLRAVF